MQLPRIFFHKADKLANLILLILSIFGSAFLIFKYGFYYEPGTALMLERGILLIFSFFLVIYTYKIFRAGTVEYLKKKRYFIYLLILITILEVISFLFKGEEVTVENILAYSNLLLIILVQFNILYQMVASAIKYNIRIAALKFRPAFLFVSTFLFLIFCGACFLKMPRAVNPGEFISFTDALFTSTSACCVTGLTVVDTATKFSVFGKIVILLLIQVGGFGMVIFGAFFALIFGKGLNLRSVAVIEDLLSDERINNIKSALIKIFRATVIIEGCGAILLAIAWQNSFSSYADLIGFSIFHSISAFCNAGFGLFTENLMHSTTQNNPLLLYTIAILIILGGLGFGSIIELFHKCTTKQKRKVRLSLQTKIVLSISTMLIVIGFIGLYFVEQNSSMQNMSVMQRINHSFFQSVTARTAGFNSIDMSMLANPTILLIIILMFIGGSPGGTAGGIKTTTLAISFISIKSIIRGERRLSFFHRNIPYRNFNSAVIVLVFSVSLIVVSTFILSFTEPKADFLTILFEEVSAFGTVGLSLNFTSSLSVAGRYIIIITMIIGRLGPLTVAVAMSGNHKKIDYEFPEEPIMIG